MPAMRRKTAAGAINVPEVPRRSWLNHELDDRSRERSAGLAASTSASLSFQSFLKPLDGSGTKSNADIAIDETIRSQPISVKDICNPSSGSGVMQNLDCTPPWQRISGSHWSIGRRVSHYNC
jgi:hypothetical protein